MSYKSLGEIEIRFAGMIWDNAPVRSGELVKMAKEQLSWQKSTTYTVLKKLCDRGFFANNGGLVTVKVSREDYQIMLSEKVVSEEYEGSLPAFIAAFTSRHQLSEKDLLEIREMIDSFIGKK